MNAQFGGFRKWQVGLGLLLLSILAVYGLISLLRAVQGPENTFLTKVFSGLDTSVRDDGEGEWESGVYVSERIWRFVSHRKLTGKRYEVRGEYGMTAVKGAYRIQWHNPTESNLKVDYSFRFLDSSELEVARYRYRDLPDFRLTPGDSTKTSGTFEILVDNIEAANSIHTMSIFASITTDK